VKRRHLVVLGGLIGVLLLFSVVNSAPPRGHMGDRAEELSLTDQQMKDLRELQYNFRKTGIGLKADLKEARLELRHQMMQDSPDKKEIARLVDQVAKAHKSVLKHEVDRKLATKEILTPEQYEKFMQRRGEGRRGERMGERGKSRQSHRGRLCPHGDGPGF
jgi:Spy/CpxP family protein refolding chaperone